MRIKQQNPGNSLLEKMACFNFCSMEKHTDNDGIKHDLEIFESQLNGETIYLLHMNGNYFIDLVKDEGEWTNYMEED